MEQELRAAVETLLAEAEMHGKAGSRKILIYEMRLWSTSYPFNVDSGAEFYGTKGKMFLSKRGKFEVFAGTNYQTILDTTDAPTDINGGYSLTVPMGHERYGFRMTGSEIALTIPFSMSCAWAGRMVENWPICSVTCSGATIRP